MKTSNNLHTTQEWEETANSLDWLEELTELNLDHGKVVKAKGLVEINKKLRLLEWNGEGLCYYQRRRIHRFDIRFNNTNQQ